MKRKSIALVIAGLILAVGGFIGTGQFCLGFPGNSQWELEVWVSSTEKLENGTVVIDGEVALSGHSTGTTVESISVVFKGKHLTQQFIQIESMAGHSQQNFSVRVQSLPEKIVIRIEKIRTGNDTDYWIKGLKQTDSGKYEQFIQRKESC